MSRTYRRAPMNTAVARRPHVQQERKQLHGLAVDAHVWDLDISPHNRIHRTITEDRLGLLWPSAMYELDHAS